ncbi:MAG: HAD family hydrolase [Candidatus Promineifilaceae bacterium]
MKRPVKAILFDLDDTLLGNDIDGFLKSYFPLLASYVSPYIDEGKFVDELMNGTQAMIRNTDPSMTNSEVFWSVFSARTGLEKTKFEPHVSTFYQYEFGKLRSKTIRLPEAESLIRSCFDQGYRLVIATNPLFPKSAIEQRLSWAGVPATEFSYDLVTTYENMHACKPHREYYDEILSHLGVEPELAIMVGDDWDNDIGGATQAGLHTYWITQDARNSSMGYPGLLGKGTLDAFYRFMKEGNIKPAV